MIDKKCGGCRFYFELNDRSGLCKRRAPTAAHWFPELGEGDWCGEFEAAKELYEQQHCCVKLGCGEGVCCCAECRVHNG